jgi:hypothetical protein
MTHQFVLELIDPNNQTVTTHFGGWVNRILTSRAFVITNTTSANNTTSSNGPLSTADKAGIAIGVIVGWVLTIACSIIIYRIISRRKAAREQASALQSQDLQKPVVLGELSDFSCLGAPVHPHAYGELDGARQAELAGERQFSTVELSAGEA